MEDLVLGQAWCLQLRLCSCQNCVVYKPFVYFSEANLSGLWQGPWGLGAQCQEEIPYSVVEITFANGMPSVSEEFTPIKHIVGAHPVSLPTLLIPTQGQNNPIGRTWMESRCPWAWILAELAVCGPQPMTRQTNKEPLLCALVSSDMMHGTCLPLVVTVKMK